MIYLKIHKTDKGDMVAMCDESLLGKVFNEGKAELNLKTYSDFYKGDLISKADAIKFIDWNALASANIVGKEAIEVVVEKGIADEGQIKTISDVPYLQVYVII